MPGQCYFQLAWLDHPEYREWVEKVPGCSTSARCRHCKKDISVKSLGVSALAVHQKGTKHMKGMYAFLFRLSNHNN